MAKNVMAYVVTVRQCICTLNNPHTRTCQSIKKQTTTKMVQIFSTIPPHHPKIVIFDRTDVLPRSHQSRYKAIAFNRSLVSLTKTSSRLVNILSSAIIEAMKRVYFTSLIYGETFCNVFLLLIIIFIYMLFCLVLIYFCQLLILSSCSFLFCIRLKCFVIFSYFIFH